MITSEELQNRLWAGANALRGSMDASRYKDYMLGLLFYKFLSEKTIEGFKAATRCQGTMDEVLAQCAQMFEKKGEQIKQALMRTPGYYVEPQYLYYTWVREINAGKFELQHVMDGIATFERMIAGAKDAEDFMNLFSTMNLNDPALGADLNMQSRNISSLIMLFEDLSIIELQQNDVIGDAYEYLIGNFAMESGKKAGEFYTPHQVSDVMARIAAHSKPDMVSIYDKIIAELIQAHRARNTSKPYEIRGFEVFLHCIGETCIQVMDKDGDFGGFLLRGGAGQKAPRLYGAGICQSTVCRVCKMSMKAGNKPVSSEFLTRGDVGENIA